MQRIYLPAALCCFFAAILVTILGVAHTQPPAPSVFAPVQMYMPGQPVRMIDLQANCDRTYPLPYGMDDYIICSFDDGTFMMASLTVADDSDTVKSLYLSVRKGAIRAGDLVHWFSDVRRGGRYALRTLTWAGGRAWCWVERRRIWTPYVYVFGIRFDEPAS